MERKEAYGKKLRKKTEREPNQLDDDSEFSPFYLIFSINFHLFYNEKGKRIILKCFQYRSPQVMQVNKL
jgi:hypothetical protein